MPASSTAILDRLTPYLQSLARIVFGFLILRHGMEQLLGYPEASAAARMSYEGILELVAVPAGLLMIAGLFTRQVGLVLAVMCVTLFFVGPLQRARSPLNDGDPVLLNAFLLALGVRRRRVERRSVTRSRIG
jgi:uncharacterized membrane protein YphA (DoxX/SURF4 family)